MPTAVRRRPYVPALLVLCCAVSPVPRARGADPRQTVDTDCLRPPFLPLQTSDTPELPDYPSLAPPHQAQGRSDGEGRIIPFTSPDALQPGDRERRKLLNKTEGQWGELKSEVVLRSPEPTHDTPFERGEWSTEDTLNIPVTGPLYFFGEAVLVGDYGADQDMKVVGRTGVMCRLPVWGQSALEVRGGPAVRYKDALRVDRARDQTAFLWEVKARMPVMGSVGLEYLGEALPALTPEDRPSLRQDVGLAIPVSGGKLKLGAKHRWEQLQQEARPWTGNMELYVGVEIGR